VGGKGEGGPTEAFGGGKGCRRSNGTPLFQELCGDGRRERKSQWDFFVGVAVETKMRQECCEQ